MPTLLVSALQSGSGKTCMISALLARLKSAGKKVAYYKPFSLNTDDDPDAAFIGEYLLGGDGLPGIPAPRLLPEKASVGQTDLVLVQQTVRQLDQAVDVVLVEGPDVQSADGINSALSSDIAAVLDCAALLILRYSEDLDAGLVLSACEPYAGRIAGVVINCVPAYRGHTVGQGLVAGIRAAGMMVLGTIPEDRTMIAVTVQQVADHLGARWVQEPVNTGVQVDRFLLGGNIMDSGATYYGRYSNQAVIVRAERPDIQLASLMEDTKCLVLTGGGAPTEYIKAEALQRDVPLMVVDDSTLNTAEALAGIIDKATSHSLHKVERFGELIDRHLDMAALMTALA